jgi:hypothetical protein
MFAQKADEPVTMCRLDQMNHLVDDNVLQQVAWREAKAERSRLRAAILALRDLCDSIL